MSYVPESISQQLELERLDAPARRDRERGERQWRNAVDELEDDDCLPVNNPGSIPNWIPLLRAGRPDWGDITRYYRGTHYLGVLIDDESLRSLTMEDYHVLAQGMVTEDLIRKVIAGDFELKRQFAKAMLKALELNEIYIPTHTSIKRVVDELRRDPPDLLETINDPDGGDRCFHDLHLLIDCPILGLRTNDIPTPVEFAICQGCKNYMPLHTRCVLLTNDTAERATNVCGLGPHREYYVPPTVERNVKLVMKEKGLPELAGRVHQFLVYPSNPYYTSNYLKTHHYIQLEKKAYDDIDVKAKRKYRPLAKLVETYYEINKHRFCNNIFDHIQMMTDLTGNEVIRGVRSWILKKQRENYHYFSMFQMEYLRASVVRFRESQDEEDRDE